MSTAKSLALGAIAIGVVAVCLLLAAFFWKRYNSPEAHLARGYNLQSRDHYHDAVGEFRAVVRLQPNSAKAHADLASALINVNDRATPGALHLYSPPAHELQEAITEYRQAIRLDPTNAYFHSLLGMEMDNQNNQAQAMAEYRKTISLLPPIAAKPWNERNVAERKNLQEHINANQIYFNVCYALAEDLQQQHQYPEAIKYFNQAIASKPDYNLPRMKLAQALIDTGQVMQARQEWMRIVQHDDQGLAPQARQMLAKYPQQL